MCARPYLTCIISFDLHNNPVTTVMMRVTEAHKGWVTIEVIHLGFETRLSYIQANILNLPKCVHICRYTCNIPQNMYINNNFFLGMRLQEEKLTTFTLNFHMCCVSGVQAHINAVTTFVGYQICHIVCPVFIETAGDCFWSFCLGLAPFRFILMSSTLRFIVILIMPFFFIDLYPKFRLFLHTYFSK